MPRAPRSKTTLVTLPLSLELWHKNPANADALRTLISSEIFKVAVATLVQANQPTGLPTAVALGSPAERMAWLAGYTDFARDLVQLTKPRGEHQELVPWGHIKPTTV
jgi:hypothetical protein